MKINQLIYLAFGNNTYQTEAFCSIATAIARSQETPDFSYDINVYTDNPEFYKNLPVNTHPIDTSWYGKINYHFRLKPAVVYECATKYQKSIFIDTDTFFKKSPKYLFDKVTNTNLLCNSIHPEFIKKIDTRVINEAKKEKLLEDNFVYINSGVIGIHKDSIETINKTIEIIDTLYDKLSFYYTLEEFSLALAANLNKTELVDCSDIIHHYWSRKLIFRKKAEAWHTKHKDNPCSQKALDDVLTITSKIPKPPAIKRLTNKLISLSITKKYRQFIRELLNASHDYSNEFDNAAAQAWIEKAFENLKSENQNITKLEVKKNLSKKLIYSRLKRLDIELEKFIPTDSEKNSGNQNTSHIKLGE